MKQVTTFAQQSSTSNALAQTTASPEPSIAGTFVSTAVSLFGFLLLVILFL
ncbi:hypothetical protein JOY44_10605 [Phormidium sp. CLA17]|uniref:hypothetical protein n=1 Tax=Leptolyngbya sp. Cla-17 TaxID=2803751 RepID=UPI00149288CF|nr:hypothetical protein [Leptolyngbya sp. Cla-17]MBM0742065.1 hypothetical protein [Leptolyngbya sp. Cla-17]